ncbi:hypothetical protein Tco_0516758, partial [Tanacetum coccineum]
PYLDVDFLVADSKFMKVAFGVDLKILLFNPLEDDERRNTAGVGIGQNWKNQNYGNFGSSVDTEKSHEDPRSSHNKEIVMGNLVKFVENYQSFD